MHHLRVLFAALLLAGATPALAEYPDHPIQIVVPYTPGGTVDLLARALGQKITAAWGQPVVIVNRPGAGGSLGADVVAKAPADGYTLLLSTNSPLTTNVALYPNLGYDPLRDFDPVISGRRKLADPRREPETAGQERHRLDRTRQERARQTQRGNIRQRLDRAFVARHLQ